MAIDIRNILQLKGEFCFLNTNCLGYSEQYKKISACQKEGKKELEYCTDTMDIFFYIPYKKNQ